MIGDFIMSAITARTVRDYAGNDQLITLENNGTLSLGWNGSAVSGVAPTTGNPACVTLTGAGGATTVIPAATFYDVILSGGVQPGPVFHGWCVARLIQAGVPLNTILTAGARYIS
jgi:hypothetical protein